MKIKETHSSFLLWLNNNFSKLYRRKFIFIIFFVFLMSLCILISIYYGMVLQRNQLGSTFKQIVYDGAVTKSNIIPNYFKGLLSNPDELFMDLNFKDLQKLNFIRDNALKRGIIIESDKNLEVEARLTLKERTYTVKISPTGQNLDMIGDPNKYAYKVTVKDGDAIYGMKEFKLIPPKSRHQIVEWIGHKIEKDEGLVALRYDFIKLNLNGTSKGVYAIEEHFNKELLENNRFKEGLLFSLSPDNGLNIYNEKKVNSDINLHKQLILLRAKWQALNNGDLEVNKVLDIEKYARFYAIIDIMDGSHATIKQNYKMYLNPVTNLIEPIAKEYNSLRYSEGPPYGDLIIENVDTEVEKNNDFIFFELYRDITFIKLYLSNLYRLTDKNYLDNFFLKYEKEINDKLNIIFKDAPYYSFPKEYMYLRQSVIRTKLAKKNNVHSYFDIETQNHLRVTIKNKSNFPIIPLGIMSGGKLVHKFNDQNILGGDLLDYTVFELKHVDSIDYTLKYRIVGLPNYEKLLIVTPKSFKTGLILPTLKPILDPNILIKPYLKINNNNKTITFKAEYLEISDNLVIPGGFKVMGRSGLNLNLINNASIISYSAIEFIGTDDEPVLIQSTDNTGQGIIIMEAKNQTIFDNVIFQNITNPNSLGWELPGAITIYESNVKFQNTTFKNNHSEDYLNIVRSKYQLIGCVFEDIHSDAFDSDFSTGTISNCTFINCVNDAIDISISHAQINKIFIENAGDKGISVGESSNLIGTEITIKNSEIALSSKDLSNMILYDVTISDSKVGCSAFQKKSEYGPANIEIKNLTFNNVTITYLIEEGSTMSVDGNSVETTEGKIKNILYGAKYGKSTK